MAPHGIFIALENVGYGLLSFAFLFVGAAMVGTPWKLWPAAGWVFVCGGALVLAALVLYTIGLRHGYAGFRIMQQ